MRKIFIIICIAIFSGCMAPNLDNKFVYSTSYGSYGFASQCQKSFFGKADFIDYEHIYSFNQYNKSKIYIFKDNKFKITDIFIGRCLFCVVPIETCNGEWCKIYYPCGDTEYFVKKDDIKQYKTWGHKK